MPDNDHHSDQPNEGEPAQRRATNLSVRLPFLSWSRSELGRQRLSVRLPFVSWTVEGDDILEAAGRRSKQERLDRSRSELAAVVISLLSGLAAAASIGVAGSVREVLGGAGGGVLAAMLTLAAVVFTAAGARLLLHQTTERRTAQRPRPANLRRLALELEAQRRSVIEKRATPPFSRDAP